MSSKKNRMVTLGEGRKAKVAFTSTFFGHTIYHTKYGVVVNGSHLNKSFASLEEAEEAVVEAIRQYNLGGSVFYGAVHNSLSPDSRGRRHGCWLGAVKWGEASPQLWSQLFKGEDGGLAVAVRVDSLGKRVDYLSLREWAEGSFELPLTGDWHYISYCL